MGAGLRAGGWLGLRLAVVVAVDVLGKVFVPNVMMIKTVALNSMMILSISCVFKVRVVSANEGFVGNRHDRCTGVRGSGGLFNPTGSACGRGGWLESSITSSIDHC